MDSNEQISLLKKHFINEGIYEFTPVNELKIIEFENNNDVLIPSDLKQYFTLINGSGDVPLDNLYEFYNIKRFNKIFDEFKDWEGIPDYSQLDYKKFDNVFVFGNYEFNFYSFGIELFKSHKFTNRVFIFCGGEYRIIADSFYSFIDVYLNHPDEIFI
ncbi:SMI1/KNR4 family protein [Chryseobacterium sp. PS-8]|uniref:SMI1/KNR4 family protein n=1 Tax=Chryseobacterium indicum TaxID=2766954 RepID=A0ABS9C054_9FLAO|nr:SMI1/KNR4 family protein [Chryseobacterium sp. PS-8]MCF2217924.1 SMI1/KNR4 family protein [Chryseobacterium sp. PS-8]